MCPEEDKKMKIMKRCLPLMVVVLALIWAIPTFATQTSITYEYDKMNRLIRVEDPTNGVVIEYEYDAVGILGT
jgi:YD repeat-containing protein